MLGGRRAEGSEAVRRIVTRSFIKRVDPFNETPFGRPECYTLYQTWCDCDARTRLQDRLQELCVAVIAVERRSLLIR